jgi:hypothetical protein
MTAKSDITYRSFDLLSIRIKISEVFSVVASIWSRICSLFDAWLTPLHDHQRQETAAWIQQLAASQKLLLPWAPGDLKWASIMAATQSKCVALLHYTVPGE